MGSSKRSRSEEEERKRKKKKHEKKKKKSKKKRSRSSSSDGHDRKKRKGKKSQDEPVGPAPPAELALEARKSFAPMSREDWEKKQSVVRKVYDGQSGRYRLVRGEGEIIEEIVSKDRHREINKQATQATGIISLFNRCLNLLIPILRDAMEGLEDPFSKNLRVSTRKK